MSSNSAMKKPHRCQRILCEGTDQQGKSTQTRMLVKHLRTEGHKVALIKSPTDDGVTYPLIYWMLHNGLARKLPNAFQVLQFINKLFFQWFSLPSLQLKCDYIIFDRWNVSMWAYGIPDGASRWLTEKMLRFIEEPDFTIILDGKAYKRDKQDSYEKDYRYQQKVRAFYLNWVVQHPSCVAQVNSNQPVQQVFDDIQRAMKVHIGANK